MKTKPLTFLLALTFLFLFSGCVERMLGVKSDVSVFHNITEQHKGKSVVVLPFQEKMVHQKPLSSLTKFPDVENNHSTLIPFEYCFVGIGSLRNVNTL